ncbi:unnamed protein product, partial [Nesidiocoris tenuis]
GESSRVINYADDTNFHVRGGSIGDCVSQVQLKYELLETWISANELQLNTSKTKLVVYSSGRRDILAAPVLLGSAGVFNFFESANFLGLEVDCRLSFRAHIGNIIPKLGSVCYCLRRLRVVSSRGHADVCLLWTFPFKSSLWHSLLGSRPQQSERYL